MTYNFVIKQVTCLQLDNQHLSKISNLEHLDNLKYVSFNDNDITKIEVLSLSLPVIGIFFFFCRKALLSCLTGPDFL